MTESLEDILRARILEDGPVDVAAFMALALGHPEHGYYMRRDPFGAAGDFVTAPEISQMFGEMIGAWAADCWMRMGSPAPFTLLECGPGRGTLMADALRATRGVAGFHEALRLHLLETSPVLKAMQAERLGAFKPVWHEGLESLPEEGSVIAIGNEFLDALPFHSLQKTAEAWCERVVAWNGSAFVFELRPAEEALLEAVPFHLRGAAAGSIFEIAPARNRFMTRLASVLKRCGGAWLFLDYGHERSACGDTFQALHRHRYVDVLSQIGQADLTSHVDFEALVQGLDPGVKVHGPVEQGAFLKALGVEARAAALSARADEKQAGDVKKALHRLVSCGEMGALFKVMCVSVDDGTGFKPCGF